MFLTPPQRLSVNTAPCTTPVDPAAPKPATTGTRSGRATSPAWPAATVPPTWCSSRAAASSPQLAPDGDLCDPGGRRVGRGGGQGLSGASWSQRHVRDERRSTWTPLTSDLPPVVEKELLRTNQLRGLLVQRFQSDHQSEGLMLPWTTRTVRAEDSRPNVCQEQKVSDVSHQTALKPAQAVS